MTPLSLLMHCPIETIASRATLREAAEMMRAKKIGALLVRDGQNDVGVISESDLVRKGIAMAKPPDETRVCDVMSHPIISIEMDQKPQEANDLMAEKGIRHLFITDRGVIVGILSVRDLVIFYKNRL